MTRNLYWIFFSLIFVFIQKYLFDSFETKIGLIFLPIFYLFFKREYRVNFYFISSMLLMSEFFNNSYLGVGTLIYFIYSDLLKYLRSNFNVEITSLLEIIGVIVIYYFQNESLLTWSFWLTLLVLAVLYLARFVRRNGYIRFN